MHDDGEQAVAIKEAVASLLVGEDAEFSHCSLDKKKPGKTSPALGSLPCGKPIILYHGLRGKLSTRNDRANGEAPTCAPAHRQAT